MSDSHSSTAGDSEYVAFYDQRRSETYGDEYTQRAAEEHTLFYPSLRRFIDDYGLETKRCLEIGSSGGCFQDMVDDYYGTDISEKLAEHYHKPYRTASGSEYPFENEMFDAIWTHAVFEHIPDLQTAMDEIVRMLKPGGVLLFFPAWQCRTWAADGYQVRPYSDFRWKGKLIKASIPIRDSLLWRSFAIFPKRIYRHAKFLMGRRPKNLQYKKIRPNYETFWISDGDACNSIDPHDAILWFETYGLQCVSHPMHAQAFFVRTGGLVFRKQIEADASHS
tara:strand:- start:254076 stop:254909 length:834 start_codon:yes stop_codon:yes gene_type:complete